MSYYEFPLTAGVAYRAGVSGKLILVDDIGAASGIDIKPVKGGRELANMPNRRDAFKAWIDYDDVLFTSSVDTTLKVFLSNQDVSLGFASGHTVTVEGEVTVNNDSGDPVPVEVTGGVTLTASDVEINNTNAAAVPVQQQMLTNVLNYSAVVAGTSQVQLIHDATLKRLRVRNAHATAVIGLGASGVTLADCPIRLGPGDMWFEEDAAGANWYVISDTAGTNVQIQGVK